MGRIAVIAVVAVCMLLGAGPADAARKSVSGVDFAHRRGSCDVSTRRGDAVVTCDLSEDTRVRYRLRIPRDAHHFRARVDRDHRGRCGSLEFTSTRFGALRRHVVVEVKIRNYGNPLGTYKGIIREVEVRYWSALA